VQFIQIIVGVDMSLNRLLGVEEMNRSLARAEAKDGPNKRNEADFIAEHFKKLEAERGVNDPSALLKELPLVWQLIPEASHHQFLNLLGMRYAACVALEEGNEQLFNEYKAQRDKFIIGLNLQPPKTSSSWQLYITAEKIIAAADDELHKNFKTLNGPALSTLLMFGANTQQKTSVFKAFAEKFKQYIGLREKQVKTVVPHVPSPSLFEAPPVVVKTSPTETKSLPKEKGVSSTLDEQSENDKLRILADQESKLPDTSGYEAFARELADQTHMTESDEKLAQYLNLLEQVNAKGWESTDEKKQLDDFEKDISRQAQKDAVNKIEAGKKENQENVRPDEYGPAPSRPRR
jgi:hypothetical protein